MEISTELWVKLATLCLVIIAIINVLNYFDSSLSQRTVDVQISNYETALRTLRNEYTSLIYDNSSTIVQQQFRISEYQRDLLEVIVRQNNLIMTLLAK